MNRLAFGFALTVVMASLLSAQVSYTAHPTAPGFAEAAYLPTAAYPNGQGMPSASHFLPNASGLPPVLLDFAGGMASDDRGRRLFTTNGLDMAVDQNLTYQNFGPLPLVPGGIAPIFLPPGVPFVSGLCYDDAANQLWACGPAMFWPMSPVTFAPLAAPQPIPLLAGQASGLGFESVSGSLFACDLGGMIYHFTTTAVPLAAPGFVPTGGPPQGLGVNTTNGPGAMAPPACSTQLPGFHVTVSDGQAIYDALGPNPPIAIGSSTIGNVIWGHTVANDFQVKDCFDAAGTTFCSYSLRAGTRRSELNTPAPQALRAIGAPPLSFGFLLVDLCPQPQCWSGLWLSPFTWILGGAASDAAGESSLFVNFGVLSPGFQFSFQYAFPDPPAPLGYCFSNLVTVTVGLP